VGQRGRQGTGCLRPYRWDVRDPLRQVFGNLQPVGFRLLVQLGKVNVAETDVFVRLEAEFSYTWNQVLTATSPK
jgi:hypothetical protein